MRVAPGLLHLVAVACVLSSFGCSPLNVTMEPAGGRVAAGTWFGVSVLASTGCGGATVSGAYAGQCVGGRTSEPDITKIEASPPLIVADEASFRINQAELYADAVGTVELTVTVQEGLNSGQLTVPFEVVDPDHITFRPACGAASTAADGAYLMLTSSSLTYSVDLALGGEALGDTAYDRLVASAGRLAVGQRRPSGDYAPSYFYSPENAGRVTLTAPRTPSFSASFDIIDRSVITALAATGAPDASDCKKGLVETRPRAGAVELCGGNLNYTLTTLTPGVCRVAATSLMETRSGAPRLSHTVTGVAAGTCRIQVDQPDAGLSEVVTFEMC